MFYIRSSDIGENKNLVREVYAGAVYYTRRHDWAWRLRFDPCIVLLVDEVMQLRKTQALTIGLCFCHKTVPGIFLSNSQNDVKYVIIATEAYVVKGKACCVMPSKLVFVRIHTRLPCLFEYYFDVGR